MTILLCVPRLDLTLAGSCSGRLAIATEWPLASEIDLHMRPPFLSSLVHAIFLGIG
jgi:hypothetical protein